MLLWLTSGHLQLGFLYIQDLSWYFHSTILSSPEMDKKFSCNLCSFETHKSSNMKIHRKLHEKIGVGPPELIKCSESDKSFITQLSSLQTTATQDVKKQCLTSRLISGTCMNTISFQWPSSAMSLLTITFGTLEKWLPTFMTPMGSMLKPSTRVWIPLRRRRNSRLKGNWAQMATWRKL